MIDPAIISAMKSAGVSDALIIATITAYANEQKEARREQERAKKARYRANIKSKENNDCVHDVPVDTVDMVDKKVSPSSPPLSPSSSSPPITPLITTTPITTPSSPSKKRAPAAARSEAVEALAKSIPVELAEAFVDHRAEIKKPITPRGAQMLAKQLAEMPDAVGAVEASIANGWQGVFANKSRAGPSGLSRERGSAASLFNFGKQGNEYVRHAIPFKSDPEDTLLIPFDGGPDR